MSYADFSSRNANYRQLYTVHTMPVRDPLFNDKKLESVDAIVLEAYHSEEWFDKLWKSDYMKHYDEIFNAVQRTNKPVYIVDVLTTAGGRGFETLGGIGLDVLGLVVAYDGIRKTTKKMKSKEMSRREFLKFHGLQFAKVLAGSYLGFHLIHGNYTTLTGNNPELLARLNSSRTHLIPTPQFELRNAISARKIEECVASELQKQTGRNPNIVLVYGAGHSGLKEDLQHPKLRNFYIELYEALGFPGIDTTYLDTITNLSIDSEGNYMLKHRQANLF